MKRYWKLACTKIDDMSLRERAMMFAAAAFVLISAINATLLDPLLDTQKAKSAQVVQQQEKMKELQATMQNLQQSKRDDEHSPLRARIALLKAQLQEHDSYMQSRRDRLVEPGNMAALLEQVLHNNDKLQLIELKTLPVGLLIDKPVTAAGQQANKSVQQIYKHGVQITVRGSYPELLRYLTALEKLPAQMFWGEVSMTVEKHPDALLTLTVYTLSMDETWLTV
ncbi:MAG: agglutinin biogenesis protein [Gallionella sp.]|nr:agglutinin biogenesis protein [Gallionella sp.]